MDIRAVASMLATGGRFGVMASLSATERASGTVGSLSAC